MSDKPEVFFLLTYSETCVEDSYHPHTSNKDSYFIDKDKAFKAFDSLIESDETKLSCVSNRISRVGIFLQEVQFDDDNTSKTIAEFINYTEFKRSTTGRLRSRRKKRD